MCIDMFHVCAWIVISICQSLCTFVDFAISTSQNQFVNNNNNNNNNTYTYIQSMRIYFMLGEELLLSYRYYLL